jgi:hypothetical protein
MGWRWAIAASGAAALSRRDTADFDVAVPGHAQPFGDVDVAAGGHAGEHPLRHHLAQRSPRCSE